MKTSHQATEQQTNAAAAFTPPGGSMLQRKCACGQHTIAGNDCDSCKKEAAAVNTLQRAAVHAGSVDQVPPIVHEVLSSPGHPLDATTRAFMEPRFGQDFSRVRVHADTKAAESALAVNALAYTVGRDLVFGTHQYEPGTTAGKRLLAHELTHTVQQANGFQAGLAFNQSGDQFEHEADRAALAISDGGLSPIHGHSHRSVTSQLMKQQGPKEKPNTSLKGSKGKNPEDHDQVYGPYLLPEVVITGTKTLPQTSKAQLLPTSGTFGTLSVRDVSFVQVEKVEDLQARQRKLNQQAEEEFQEEIIRLQQRAQATTVSDASPKAALEAKQAENRKAQEELKRAFGDGWGLVFWWTRGGVDDAGESSPLWTLMNRIRTFNRAYPMQAYPNQPRVFRDRVPNVPKTEVMLLPANRR